MPTTKNFEPGGPEWSEALWRIKQAYAEVARISTDDDAGEYVRITEVSAIAGRTTYVVSGPLFVTVVLTPEQVAEADASRPKPDEPSGAA